MNAERAARGEKPARAKPIPLGKEISGRTEAKRGLYGGRLSWRAPKELPLSVDNSRRPRRRGRRLPPAFPPLAFLK